MVSDPCPKTFCLGQGSDTGVPGNRRRDMTGKRIVVKVGTSTLTYATGHLNIRRVEKIVKTIADLQNAGNQMILVSSGSIALGMSSTNAGS